MRDNVLPALPGGRRFDPESLLLGRSAAMRGLRAALPRVAAAACNVLLTGETGAGKDCVARALHECSPRAAQPMVCINCAALPDTLIESELFGHARGAFTGAQAAYAGKMKLADGGTLFLDEVGELSPAAQAKMLRALETREIFPLGALRPVPIDVRIVAATNQPLEQSVAAGRFRADLYYRLNVARVRIPPLRERRDDIPLLLAHFAVELKPRARPRPLEFAARTLAALQDYGWPGNCRELRNLVESAYISAADAPLEPEDLPDTFAAAPAPAEGERLRIVATLQQCQWNCSEAARRLCWSRMTLYRKMKRHAISPALREFARHAD